MGRRIMFLWSILQKDDTEIVRAVYNIQRDIPIKNDWINLVKDDLQSCGINYDESEIKAYSKLTFKRLVKDKLQKLYKNIQ